MMSDDCGKPCMFHDQYEKKLTDVYDWSQGAKVKIPLICKKVDDNYKANRHELNDLREDMEKQISEIKADLNSGVKRLIFVVIGSVILQVVAGIFLHGGLK